MKQYEALKIKYRYEAGGTWCLVNDGGVIVAAFSSKNTVSYTHLTLPTRAVV